jgi:hypothetical protein
VLLTRELVTGTLFAIDLDRGTTNHPVIMAPTKTILGWVGALDTVVALLAASELTVLSFHATPVEVVVVTFCIP